MEPGILQLEVLKGPKKGEILVCKPESKVQIGRVKKGNDFAIRDPGISQSHLCIQYVSESSRWFVADMDSSNGTIHHGSKIQPLVPVPISDGDVIKIGEKVELGVKIVLPVVVKGNEEENGGVKAMKVYTRRGLAKDGTKAGSSRGTEEEEVKDKENECKISVPVRLRGGRNCAQASKARVSNEEEASDHKEDRKKGKGGGQRRKNAKENANSGFGEEMKENRDPSLQIEEPDQSGLKLRRNPRRGNSSKALKEVDMNRMVGVGIEGKAVDLKKNNGKGGVTEVLHGEIHHSSDNLLLDSDCVNITDKGKGLKGIETVCSPMVTEEEKGDGHTGLKEGLEVNSKAGDQIENMTVEQWFDSTALSLRKAVQDEAAEIINNLKEKARKFDEFIESGSNV